MKASDLAVTASKANPQSETIGVKRLTAQLPDDLSQVTDPKASNQISDFKFNIANAQAGASARYQE